VRTPWAGPWKTHFEVKKNIEAKRDAFEKHLHHACDIRERFTILWSVGQQGNVSIHCRNIDTFH
jgi:hypothetical protein